MKIRHITSAFALASAVGFAGTAIAQDAELVPDISLGADDAPVTVIEYASFTCGHCANFHDENWPKLKEDYVDTGKVKFIQREIYFDALGLWAGILARCGGDDSYYAISDMLFEEQRDWMSGSTGEEVAENLRQIGAKADLSTEEMDACWNNKENVDRLLATFQHYAEEDGVDATPTFIIGGEKVANMPWAELSAKIDEKIEDAEG